MQRLHMEGLNMCTSNVPHSHPSSVQAFPEALPTRNDAALGSGGGGADEDEVVVGEAGGAVVTRGRCMTTSVKP